MRGFRTVATRYFSDGGVELDVEVPLDAVGDAVLPKAAAAPAPAGPTSLVVDATGLKVAPALAPRLLDETGKELYGPSALGESARKAGGVAAYARSLDAARRDLAARLGDRPLVVKAIRAQGTDLVLSAADAAPVAVPAAVPGRGARRHHHRLGPGEPRHEAHPRHRLPRRRLRRRRRRRRRQDHRGDRPGRRRRRPARRQGRRQGRRAPQLRPAGGHHHRHRRHRDRPGQAALRQDLRPLHRLHPQVHRARGPAGREHLGDQAPLRGLRGASWTRT